MEIGVEAEDETFTELLAKNQWRESLRKSSLKRIFHEKLFEVRNVFLVAAEPKTIASGFLLCSDKSLNVSQRV